MTAMMRIKEVIIATGMSASTISRAEKAGCFPRRRKLTGIGRSIGWLSDDIENWLRTREPAAMAVEGTIVGK